MSSPPVVLVTGATGFLGSAILERMLREDTDLRPLFLVRASDPVAGLERLRESLRVFEPREAIHARLSEEQVLCGDLESFPGLLDDPRLREVTHVLSCGALASFAWKPEVWQVNVEHTSAFAEACARLPRLRRFLHVSTAMISGDTAGGLLHEDDFPAEVRHFVPYTKSKAEIERRLPALLGEVPLVIARPSIVVGHTRAGCAASPSIFWIFRMIHAARLLPFPVTHRIDLIPVDWCAEALVALTLAPTLQHRTYHVSAGEGACDSFARIDAALSASEGAGPHEVLREFDPATLPAIEHRFEEWFGPCDPKRMSSAIRLYRAFAGLDVRFDNRRLLAEGIAPPPHFSEYAGRCLATAGGQPVAEQMLYDFR